jgi:hypothetical protein
MDKVVESANVAYRFDYLQRLLFNSDSPLNDTKKVTGLKIFHKATMTFKIY